MPRLWALWCAVCLAGGWYLLPGATWHSVQPSASPSGLVSGLCPLRRCPQLRGGSGIVGCGGRGDQGSEGKLKDSGVGGLARGKSGLFRGKARAAGDLITDVGWRVGRWLILGSSITLLREEEIPKRSAGTSGQADLLVLQWGFHTEAPEPGAQVPSSPSAAKASWLSSLPGCC